VIAFVIIFFLSGCGTKAKKVKDPFVYIKEQLNKLESYTATANVELYNNKIESKYTVMQFYKKGKLHGPFKSYSETGKLSQTGNYTNGEPSGVWNYYMDNGVRYKTLDYNNAVTIWYKKDGEEVDRVDNW